MTPEQRSRPARRLDHDEGLAEQVARELQDRVDRGELAVGSWLRQEKLARDFDLGRMAIREAIQRLHARGVVELIPNRGARVRRFSDRDIREAYQVRAELEGLAAELAARLATDDQLARLRHAEELFEQAVSSETARTSTALDEPAGSARGWSEANDLFHSVVHEAACNERLRRTIEDLHRSFPRNLTWSALGSDLRLLSENVAQHRAIRTAIEAGDGEEARRLMVSHVSRSGELLAIRAGSREGDR
jgi:DNA-binding GntR family transcriptional regulator